MSIIAYSGLPGSGKSYSVVENVILPALKDGRTVAHNLTLNLPAIAVVVEGFHPAQLIEIPRDCTPQELITKCPPGAVIVIDEVWRYWPAGTKANEVPQAELKFFKEHRHRVGDDGKASEICIIDQDIQTGVPAFLRSLIEITYLHEKMSKVGAKGRFRVDVYARAQSAMKPSKGALLRKMAGKYRPEVWNCYISHTQSTSKIGEAGLELQADKRGTVLGSWTVRAAICAAIAMPFLLYAASASIYNLGKVERPTTTTTTRTVELPPDLPALPQIGQQAPLPPQPSAPPATSPAPSDLATSITPGAESLPPGLSRTWRVSGGIARADGSGVVLLVSTNGSRRIHASDCTLDDLLEWRCAVEDGDATMHSGAPAAYSAAQPRAADTAP
jgi:zona occludens toxin